MNAQPSLFGQTEVRGGGQPPAPRPMPKRRTAVLLRKPEVPFAQPDKQGKYWYERFYDDLQALPETEREVVAQMILLWPYERMNTARKLLDRYCRAHVREQDNLHEAMGR